MFEALGRVIYRRRRWVVALAVAFVVFAGVWGTGVFGAMTGGGFEDPDSESSRAAAVAAQALGRDSADVVVLYRSDDLHRRRPRLPDARWTDSLARCRERPRRPDDDLLGHRSPRAWSAPTGTSTFAVLQLAGDVDDEDAIAPDPRPSCTRPGCTTQIGGNAVVNTDINGQVSADIARAETISLPILLVLLVIIFGSLAAA